MLTAAPRWLRCNHERTVQRPHALGDYQGNDRRRARTGRAVCVVRTVRRDLLPPPAEAPPVKRDIFAGLLHDGVQPLAFVPTVNPPENHPMHTESELGNEGERRLLADLALPLTDIEARKPEEPTPSDAEGSIELALFCEGEYVESV